MNWILLTPPLAFLILLIIIAALSWFANRLSPKGVKSAGKGEPYACGQDVSTGRIQPSYSDFFPFAFFFTIIHVTALVLATVPASAVWLAIPFLAITALAILILFRRDEADDH